MSKKAVVTSLLLTAAAVVAVAAPAAAGENPEWVLQDCVDASGAPTTKLASDTKCELKNTKSGQCLIRDSHMGQADLDFASCDKHPKSVLFHKEGGGAIAYGDTVAMQLGVGSHKAEWYRKCVNPQTVGINICSEGGSPDKKHYDWKLKGGSGQVKVGKPIALFNVSRNDSVVFAKLPSKVVDLCWDASMRGGYCTNPRPK